MPLRFEPVLPKLQADSRDVARARRRRSRVVGAVTWLFVIGFLVVLWLGL
jgi:hypothetical protein